jgi:hypothetical protein
MSVKVQSEMKVAMIDFLSDEEEATGRYTRRESKCLSSVGRLGGVMRNAV